MNDADFEMLAREGGGAFDAWLRQRALTLAIDAIRVGNVRVDTDVSELAEEYFQFIKGNSDDNLHRQYQR